MKYEDTLPRIRISRAELAEILVAGARSRGVFSCNDRCEVWPAVKRGHIPPADREYIDLAILDEIAGAVVLASPGGGRFRVTSDGVFLMRTGEQLFVFEIV